MPVPESKKKKAAVVARKVIHPEFRAELAVGKTPLTVAKAKELMGWQVEGDEKFGQDFLVSTAEGKCRALNNLSNRPLTMSAVMDLKQQVLMKRWRVNGEAIIIGETGIVLNGQHTMVALILAEEDRKADPYWKDYWKGPVSIEKLIVYGVSESDDVVNTMDTAKPRSLADVIYRSPYFADVPAQNRKVIARIMDYAIRFVWHRTGAGVDAYAPRRTHAEALDFIARHPKIKEAVKHIFDEDEKKAIGKYVAPGTAAGMMYLMGVSQSDAAKYDDNRRESSLDLSRWKKAEEFWTIMASGTHKDLGGVRKALGSLADAETGTGGTGAEKVAIIAKAWTFMVENEWKEPTEAKIRLKYHTEDDITRLDECPTVGGIDLGNPKVKDDDEEVEGEGEAEPTPEEVKAHKEKIKADNLKASRDKPAEEVEPGPTDAADEAPGE